MAWVVELGAYDIQYEPRTVIKGQVVPNFIAELTYDKEPSEQTPTGESSIPSNVLPHSEEAMNPGSTEQTPQGESSLKEDKG